MVEWLFLGVSFGCLRLVIVVFFFIILTYYFFTQTFDCFRKADQIFFSVVKKTCQTSKSHLGFQTQLYPENSRDKYMYRLFNVLCW